MVSASALRPQHDDEPSVHSTVADWSVLFFVSKCLSLFLSRISLMHGYSGGVVVWWTGAYIQCKGSVQLHFQVITFGCMSEV